MNLFLDDLRHPWYMSHYKLPMMDWEIVRNYYEFVDTIQKHYLDLKELPKVISFDHDLSELHYSGDFSGEKTGYDCAKWLCDFCMEHDLDFPEYHVHSMNPIGKENIISIIESYKKSRCVD